MKKKIFRDWRLYGIKWWLRLYMALTPTLTWKDEDGIHYEKKVGNKVYKQDFK